MLHGWWSAHDTVVKQNSRENLQDHPNHGLGFGTMRKRAKLLRLVHN